MKKRNIFSGLFYLVLAVVGINVFVGGQVDKEGAKKAAEAYGLSDVKITGKAPLFSVDGYYRTQFSAVNSKGERVTGVVGQGYKWMGTPPTVKLNNN